MQCIYLFISAAYVPSSISIDRWKIKATSELGDDTEVKDLVPKLVAFRDEKLIEYLAFEEALKSGKAERFKALDKPVVDFDIFMKRIESFHVLTSLPDEEKRCDMHHSCTCRPYQDKGRCKHSIREGVAQGKFDDETKKSIEKKHKRGRPKKGIKKGDALNMESYEYRNDSSDEEMYAADEMGAKPEVEAPSGEGAASDEVAK